MVLKIYQNANSPQGCGLYFAKYSPQPSSNIPHGEFLSTVNLNFVPQTDNSTSSIRIQNLCVWFGLRGRPEKTTDAVSPCKIMLEETMVDKFVG